MCGRLTLTLSPEEISEWFDIDVDVDELDLVARYNVAPTQNIPVVRNDAGRHRLDIMRWGLVPPYEKEFKSKYLLTNARDDKIQESRIFQRPFISRRCLIPATGFYEWKKGPGKTKQPMMIRLKSGEPFAFAGIWERWFDKSKQDSEAALSCSIITTRPNSLMEPIHDRMPVILPPELYEAWLNPDNQNVGELKEFLLPYDPGLMEAYPISNLVNSVKNDGPELIEPV
jgi:putative SOS response-associated peptidase YedK